MRPRVLAFTRILHSAMSGKFASHTEIDRSDRNESVRRSQPISELKLAFSRILLKPRIRLFLSEDFVPFEQIALTNYLIELHFDHLKAVFTLSQYLHPHPPISTHLRQSELLFPPYRPIPMAHGAPTPARSQGAAISVRSTVSYIPREPGEASFTRR